MKSKLQRIHSPWRRLIISLLINFLLWASKQQRARAHWVGRRRPRFERPIIVLLFAAAIVLLEPHEYAAWAAIWGSITSLFVIVLALFQVLPRSRTD